MESQSKTEAEIESLASLPAKKTPPKPKKGSGKKSHSRHKRPPQRLSQRPNDVYINRSTQFAGQLARCRRLLDQGYNEVTIHGLGAAIHRAINLSLQLRDTSTTPLMLQCTTSTVELVDDLEPLNDDADYQTQTRLNSAIHIQLSQVSSPLSSQTSPTPPQASQPSPHTPTQSPPSQAPQSTPSRHTGRRKSSRREQKKSGQNSTSKDHPTSKTV